MKKARLGMSLTGSGILLMGCLGCVSQKDLSSYSEGRTQGVGQLGSPTDGSPSDAGSSTAGQAGQAGQAEQAGATNQPAVDEQAPTDVPLAPTPVMPPPAEPADPPSADPEGTCSAEGEFTALASGSCYLLGEATSSWAAARELCQTWGGDLVEIGSAEEQTALRNLSDEDAWIGANDRDVEGTFTWAGGAPVQYAAWAFGQPDDNQDNEDCAELRRSDDAWNDVPCTGTAEKLAFCERSLSPSDD